MKPRARYARIDRESIKPADQFEPMIQGRALFMVQPTYYDVLQEQNPHMLDLNGCLNRVSKDLAYRQWEKLAEAYRSLGMQLRTFKGGSDCPDMTFCANQTLPYLDRQGSAGLLLGQMHHEARQKEVSLLAEQLQQLGLEIRRLPASMASLSFEGMGDALWVPGRRLICAGYGFRSDERVYPAISELVDAPVALFQLKNPKFYHLDTCLSILDDKTALACREGFTEEGWELLLQLFPNIIEASLAESDAPYFACNAHCPDQKHVIIQNSTPRLRQAILEYGFKVVEVDTSEFIKSGGSVFCLKMQCLWDTWPL